VLSISHRVRAEPHGPTSPYPTTTTTCLRSTMCSSASSDASFSSDGRVGNLVPSAVGFALSSVGLTPLTHVSAGDGLASDTASGGSDDSALATAPACVRLARIAPVVSRRSLIVCHPPVVSAHSGCSDANCTRSGCSSDERLNACSAVENVRHPSSSTPGATMLFWYMSADRVHPMTHAAIERYGCHPSEPHLFTRDSHPSFDSAYRPSLPNTPWLGEHGSRVNAGRFVMPRSCFAFLTAPRRRTTLVSMSLCAISENESMRPMSRPPSGMAAKGMM
jgi:hypothetical protein